MKHGPDLTNEVRNFRSVGHFGESLFGIILHYTNQSHFFWSQLSLQNFFVPRKKMTRFLPVFLSLVGMQIIY